MYKLQNIVLIKLFYTSLLKKHLNLIYIIFESFIYYSRIKTRTTLLW